MDSTLERWSTWPGDAAALRAAQVALAAAAELEPRADLATGALIGGCFACFDPTDHAFAGAAALDRSQVVATALATGVAGHAYEPGLLALREGDVLERAVRRLPVVPDLLLVNATGADHPRRAGLAVHLGAVLDVPTVGVTHRPLYARGQWPEDERGAVSPLIDDTGDLVGAWLRTRAGRRPVAVHAGWRTTVDLAVAAVIGAARRARTPEPLRRAREVARRARAGHPVNP
jgi:deoxyribonuclease V